MIAKVGDKIRIIDGCSAGFRIHDILTVKRVGEHSVYAEETWDNIYHHEYEIVSEVSE